MEKSQDADPEFGENKDIAESAASVQEAVSQIKLHEAEKNLFEMKV